MNFKGGGVHLLGAPSTNVSKKITILKDRGPNIFKSPSLLSVGKTTVNQASG